MPKNIPTIVKFMYKKKERLWVKVDKLEKDIVFDKLANNPISTGLTFNDLVKLKLSSVIDYIY